MNSLSFKWIFLASGLKPSKFRSASESVIVYENQALKTFHNGGGHRRLHEPACWWRTSPYAVHSQHVQNSRLWHGQAMSPFVRGTVNLPQARFFLAAGFATFCCAAKVFAGPPLITDDPDTPGPNNWEIETAIISQYANHQWQLQAPFLDNNYGVGDHIELTYEIGWNTVVPNNSGALSGLGDSLLGAKWRFLDQDKSWLDVSVYPQVQFNNPTSSARRGIAEDGTSVILPFEMGHMWGPLDVYTEPGFTWNQRGLNQGFWGLAAEYDLTKKFALMGELHYDFEGTFEQNELLFNLGFSQTLSEHVALIGSVGRAVFGPSNIIPNFMSYLGLELTF
jgi:hypothetical protein